MASWGSLTSGRKKFVLLLCIALFLVYSGITLVFAKWGHDSKLQSMQNHALRMNPTSVEAGKTPPDELPEKGDFIPVSVGMYLDDIDTLSIKDSYFNVNAYVWFRWKGEKSLDPGSKFVLVDGKIDKKDLLEEYTSPDGVNYQKYRITARIIKFFNTTVTPLEAHMLNIYIEDGGRDGTKLRYVPDKGSNISSRVSIPGFNVKGSSTVVKNHTYKSNYGDPRMDENARKTFTQFIFAVDIERNGYGLYFKTLVGLFAACILALVAFFIRPSDVGPRFALPTGAYFGAVANTYVANSILPSSGTFGLMDYVYSIGLLTICITLIYSLISFYLFVIKEEKALAKVLDKSVFCVLAISFVIANVAIPLASAFI